MCGREGEGDGAKMTVRVQIEIYGSKRLPHVSFCTLPVPTNH